VDEVPEPARLERYVTELFAAEDPILSKIRARHAAENLPAINVSPEEGKLLHLLLLSIQAKRVLEIGSLGGYSGVWLARALPPSGTLITIERDPRHAGIAREAFRTAGLEERVELIEGGALEVLPTLSPGFDAVFIDADKGPLPRYFDWGMRLLRRGGLLLCDNAFFHGAALDENDRSDNAIGVRAFNQLAATDPRLVATIIPVRDGLVIGLKTRDTA
jgi:predicted O-methyltransferase YrrM